MSDLGVEQVGKPLSDLPELLTPTDGDLMYIVDAEASANSASKKITMSNLKRVLGGNVTGTVEGDSVSFSDGADGIPMKECKVTIIPIQTGSGTPSPSNVRPISGHTDVTVTVASTSGGSGEDTTVSLGRTVYGGTLDVTTGELTVDRIGAVMSDLTWTKIDTSAGHTRYKSSVITGMKATDTRTMNVLCSIFATNTSAPYLSDSIYNAGNESALVAVSDSWSELSDFMQGIDGQTVVVDLATPQTFTLTKEQIQTLLGQNYVSHDGGGNIKVVYIRDLDIVINDLINRVTALENE